MLKARLIVGIQSLLLLGSLLLSACGATAADLTPTATVNPAAIRTEAVSTFAADLTLTALAAPTDTPVPTLTPAPTLPPLSTSTPGTGLGTSAAGGTTSSCYSMLYVSDVTVPDNTAVAPGEKFTKTWKVKNAGTCAWDAGFKFSFVSGDAMGGTTYTLPAAVPAGQTTDISIPMTAPNKSGTVRGDWQLFTAGGQAVLGGVYVQVVVGGGAAATNTTGAPALTNTPTATPTSTTATGT